VSHIAAGYIINSPTQGIVRATVTSNDGLQSSTFNYANVTDAGLVDNTYITYPTNSADQPIVWRDYVDSSFPIFKNSILVDSGAVYAGLAESRFHKGEVAAVSDPFYS
jgi:hypothetical protein